MLCTALFLLDNQIRLIIILLTALQLPFAYTFAFLLTCYLILPGQLKRNWTTMDGQALRYLMSSLMSFHCRSEALTNNLCLLCSVGQIC
jgi:hypothetical protein